jgi:hypothetical protein
MTVVSERLAARSCGSRAKKASSMSSTRVSQSLSEYAISVALQRVLIGLMAAPAHGIAIQVLGRHE